MILSQLGIKEEGNKVLLANKRGRFNRFITAIGVSILVDRIPINMKIEDNPKLIRNKAMKTPIRLKGVNVEPVFNPSINAKTNTITACIKDLITDENIFDMMMIPRATGVLRTLFRKPKRLSQTIDIPLNIVVNNTTKASIPTDMKEK